MYFSEIKVASKSIFFIAVPSSFSGVSFDLNKDEDKIL